MKSKDEFKKIDVKNCTCYYFDDVMRYIDINFNDTYDGIKYLALRGCERYNAIIIVLNI